LSEADADDLNEVVAGDGDDRMGGRHARDEEPATCKAALL
jgi:hypothetical protein